MDRIWQFLLDGTLIQWKWTKKGTVMLVGDLGTWPAIAGIKDREEEWQKIGEWSIEEKESSKSQTI